MCAVVNGRKMKLLILVGGSRYCFESPDQKTHFFSVCCVLVMVF
jgi:hypothetical protein